ncbi:MAG: hypothetical protein Q8909_05915 [Bacteroidota bacterium]|nr:hypothetical protein [Bacteroidota bacterium]
MRTFHFAIASLLVTTISAQAQNSKILTSKSDTLYSNDKQVTKVTTPKQTQGATFGEKVNQGIHAAGSAINQGASLVGGALPGGAIVSARQIPNSMPNRISMNVTVARQTQGATFGERTNSTAAGSIHISLTDDGCVVFMPDNTTIQVNTRTQTALQLDEKEAILLKSKLTARDALWVKGTNSTAANLPGGSIISAAVSSVSALAGSGGGATSASYAATGRTAAGRHLIAELPDNDCDDVLRLPDGDYEISFKVVEKATSGLKDTLKTQVRIGFTLQGNTLKTKHDTAKNAINNVR